MSRNIQLPKVGARRSFVLFSVVLVAFVIETQLTQYLQTDLGYRQPFFIFYLVHSSFAIIFPCHLLFQFLRLILALTFGLTYPRPAVVHRNKLSPVSEATIWNTNAFFAYLMTFRFKWEPRKFFAVSLATVGVLIVVDGRSSLEERKAAGSAKPIVGDLLTLVASVGYALYQVLYKKYAALPSDPELRAEAEYEHLPTSDEVQYEAPGVALDSDDDAVYPPPFGLHPNLLTSAIGLCTLSVLWIFIPILHHIGAEPFLLPGSLKVIFTIVGIALSGVVFNAGFMVLLGVWGPIITSVGNLLTIVLVSISDVLWGAGLEAVTLGSVVGCSVIVAAFGVLVYDMLDKRRQITGPTD
ncbi:hypothetical protein B0H14DRAFT_2673223 [Mycena olivaceomarginata]|nr:hypothetical protein B0H14DRAFT_2673223 [Mycena olivaceomarginata]